MRLDKRGRMDYTENKRRLQRGFYRKISFPETANGKEGMGRGRRTYDRQRQSGTEGTSC